MYQTTGEEAKSAGSHSFTAVHNPPIDQLIEKRRSYLTLEFPFQTDTISLNHALVKHAYVFDLLKKETAATFVFGDNVFVMKVLGFERDIKNFKQK